jgi:hypothetical protein
MKTTAAEDRLIAATVEISRLALYLNMPPAQLRAALGDCHLTLAKDKQDVIASHRELFPEWELTE